MLNFELCLKYSHSKCKQKPSTSLGQEIPVHPWTKLATDNSHFEDTSYLLIVDYTSRFLVVCKLSSMTGVHVANQCNLVFLEYGWPETLISDNGPCYTSQAFISAMKAFSVNHITSSPHCFAKPKKKVKIYTSFWWSTTILSLQVACSCLCRFCKVEVLVLTCQCLMLLGNSLVSSLK